MKQIAFSFALIIGLSVSMYGQEFELLTGGSVTGTTLPMIRSNQVGIGFTAPTSGTYPSPSVARLIVQSGNIGHFVNGQYGSFGSTDQWLGLGTAGVGTAYGLAITKNTSTGVFNLLDEGTQTNLIAGFGGTASTNTNRFKIRGFSGTSLTPK
ncbi:MAG: hypothetical protein WCR52_23905, partial [Bacteroidota bacterium]